MASPKSGGAEVGTEYAEKKRSQNEKFKKIQSKPSFQAQRAKRGKT